MSWPGEGGDGEREPRAIPAEVERLFALFRVGRQGAVGEPITSRLVSHVDDPARGLDVTDGELQCEGERQAGLDWTRRKHRYACPALYRPGAKCRCCPDEQLLVERAQVAGPPIVGVTGRHGLVPYFCGGRSNLRVGEAAG